jgi:transposase
MSEQFWLSEEQMDNLAPYFPHSRGKARVDDRRVLSGIIHVQRNGLRWCDAPAIYGPHKTLYNRHVRWTRNGVFGRLFAALALAAGPPERIIIDSTHLKAHRTAASLLQKKGVRGRSDAPKVG